MENKTPRHRHTPSDPRAQQRNVIDGRPIDVYKRQVSESRMVSSQV